MVDLARFTSQAGNASGCKKYYLKGQQRQVSWRNRQLRHHDQWRCNCLFRFGVFRQNTSNTNARHSHSNKAVLDSINESKIAKWDSASEGAGNVVKTKVVFSADDAKWGSIANGLYPLTISHNGKSLIGGVHKTDGSNNCEVIVDVDCQASNIVIYSADKFAGYIELV